MNNTLDKLRDDLNNIIDEVLCKYFGEEVKDIEQDLKEKVRFLLWEYEMQNLIK